MQKVDLERLRIAAEQFYLDLHRDQPHMSDIEYDTLAKEYEAETGLSVKTLVDWSKVGEVEHMHDLPSLKKIQVQDNDLRSAVERWIEKNGVKDYYLNKKLDGSSVRAYYVRGRLQKVVGAPDEKFGILRTDTLGCLFPERIYDESIESLVGELIVDSSIFGYNSRNKSNGLANSKDMAEDIKKYAIVQIYRVTYHDEDGFNGYNYERQKKSLELLKGAKMIDGGGRVYFKVAEQFGLDEVPDKSLGFYHGENTQHDGVVLYSDKGLMAFKYYFSEIGTAVVKRITYRLQKNGNYFPKIWFDPITVEGKRVSKCSGGSLRLVKEKGLGIGAEFQLIMSNSVIPKVLKVTKPSFDIPNPE